MLGTNWEHKNISIWWEWGLRWGWLLQISIGIIGAWFGCMLMVSMLLWLWTNLKKDNRIHYVEVHEMKWCPAFLREYIQLSLYYCWIMLGLHWMTGGSPAHTIADVVMEKLLAPLLSSSSASASASFLDKKEKKDSNQEQGQTTISAAAATATATASSFAKRTKDQIKEEEEINKKKRHITWIDLCSGGGGPMPQIHQSLKEKYQLSIDTYLSDLFPTVNQWKKLCQKYNHLHYIEKSLNVMTWNEKDIYNNNNNNNNNNDIIVESIYGSFHHFQPDQNVQMLSNCMQQGHAFVCGELFIKREHILDFIKVPFFLAALTPFFIFAIIRHQLFFQNNNWYKKVMNIILCIMTLPLWATLMIHDGTVSCARSYTVEQMLELAEQAKQLALKQQEKSQQQQQQLIYNYEWKAWTEPSRLSFFFLNKLLPITFLIGVPYPIKK